MIRVLTLSFVFVILFACCAIPALSQPTLGIYYETDPYYDPYAMPEIYSFFDGYLVLHNADCGVTAVEFRVGICSYDIQIVDWTVPPEATVYLGDPYSGMSIAYWPPLNGFAEEYLLLCTVTFLNIGGCYFDGGPLMDCVIDVRPHPDTGAIRFACAPDNELFPAIGLTSIVCRYVWPPYIWYVIVEDFDRIRAQFDQALTPESAEDESRYRVIEHSSPPETLSVVSASLIAPGSGSVRLTLERNMIDDTDYTLLATEICNEYTCNDDESYFHFNAAIGTALRSFSAEKCGEGIRITWLMDEIDDGVEFIVLRSEGGSGGYTGIPGAAIERNGLEFRYTDQNIEPGRTYRYKIGYILNGESRLLLETDPIETPVMPLTLHQNVPNPFNPSTTIQYYLPEPCRVTLDIFDVGGKRIARLVDRTDGPGYRETVWNGIDETGRAAASGIYLYRLTAGKETLAKKMVLLK